MAARRRLGKVTDAVVDAAKVAVEATTDYVIQPVGKALGLTGDSSEAPSAPAADKPQPKAVRKAARKEYVERAEAAAQSDKAARRHRIRR